MEEPFKSNLGPAFNFPTKENIDKNIQTAITEMHLFLKGIKDPLEQEAVLFVTVSQMLAAYAGGKGPFDSNDPGSSQTYFTNRFESIYDVATRANGFGEARLRGESLKRFRKTFDELAHIARKNNLKIDLTKFSTPQ